MLKRLNFSLKVNHKKNESCGKVTPEDRDNQFKYISNLREDFSSKGFPVISIDTKKKELIGNFKNNGAAYNREPEYVDCYDFPSDAIGKGILYGIYDVTENNGFVFIGTSSDIPSFAVDSVEEWWNKVGKRQYSYAPELLILADGGGSNSSRSRVWKFELQNKLCSKYRIKVTVCHYPPGCSKWNPIEHRLFNAISNNWAGKPLRSYETMLNDIRTTTTLKGLEVEACLVPKRYEKGKRISDEQMSCLKIEKHTTFPKWNYTLTY